MESIANSNPSDQWPWIQAISLAQTLLLTQTAVTATAMELIANLVAMMDGHGTI